MKHTGSCLCGKIKFTYTGELGAASYCHCDDCRKATGGPYTISVMVERDKLQIENENLLKAYECTADSGNKLDRVFCSNCGSPIMTTHPHNKNLAWFKAGLFDRPELIKSVHESWTTKKVSWADIKVSKSYPKNPEA